MFAELAALATEFFAAVGEGASAASVGAEAAGTAAEAAGAATAGVGATETLAGAGAATGAEAGAAGVGEATLEAGGKITDATAKAFEQAEAAEGAEGAEATSQLSPKTKSFARDVGAGLSGKDNLVYNADGSINWTRSAVRTSGNLASSYAKSKLAGAGRSQSKVRSMAVNTFMK